MIQKTGKNYREDIHNIEDHTVEAVIKERCIFLTGGGDISPVNFLEDHNENALKKTAHFSKSFVKWLHIWMFARDICQFEEVSLTILLQDLIFLDLGNFVPLLIDLERF